jgi:hypothetical protein
VRWPRRRPVVEPIIECLVGAIEHSLRSRPIVLLVSRLATLWCGLSNSLRPSDSPLRLYAPPAPVDGAHRGCMRPGPHGARVPHPTGCGGAAHPLTQPLSVARPWSRRAASQQGQAAAPSPRAAPRRADAKGRPAVPGIDSRPAIRILSKEGSHPPGGAPPQSATPRTCTPQPLRRSPHGGSRSAPSRDKPLTARLVGRPKGRSFRGAAASGRSTLLALTTSDL